MFQRLFQSYRLQHELFHYLEKDPDCAERHKSHKQEVKYFMHDKTLFYEQKRDTDAALADLEKPEVIPGFGFISKDSQSFAHGRIVQEMPDLNYLDHDIKTSKI